MVEIREHDVREPLDGLETIGFWHHQSDWSTTCAVESILVKFVKQDYQRQFEGVFQHTVNRQQTAEHLLGVVVVVSVIKDPTQILPWLLQRDYHAQRDTFPNTGAQRAAKVQAS